MPAQIAGSLDPSFNPAASTDDPARSVAVQADGRILLGSGFTVVNGQPRNRIARLNADGTLESASTFNPDSALSPYAVHCLAVQPDGKILIGGYFIIARRHADGTLDTALNPETYDGRSFVDCLAVQSDGKVLIGGAFNSVQGQPRNGIARLYPNGTVESTATFNVGTGAGWVRSVAVQEDGKIVIGGEFYSVDGQPRRSIARLNPDGSLESTTTFNAVTDMSGFYQVVYCVVLQADGKILLGGGFTSLNGQARNYIARLLPNGGIESTATFNPGTGPNGEVRSIALQADGKILLGGHFTHVNGQQRNHIARLNADGTLESTAKFNSGTGTESSIQSVALQADGKILLSGNFASFNGQPRNHIARLANDLAVETLTVPDSTRVRWMREGAAPEVGHVSFEFSTDDGANWTALGRGTRTTGGWEWTGLSLPPVGFVRARGRTTGGFQNGSSGVVESAAHFNSGTPVPEIAVEQPPGTFVPEGGSRDFGTVEVGSQSSLTFSIRNFGNADLTGLTLTKDGADAEWFAITTAPESPVGPGGSTTFTVRFAPTSAGTKTAALHIASNDTDENPFDIVLSGNGIVFDLAIEQPAGNELADDAGAVDFGSPKIGYSTEVKTFTVRNVGTGLLTGLTLSKDGAHSGDFNVTPLGGATLPASATMTFNVTFTPSATGARSAVLHLMSNDPDESPFDINLMGTGTMPKIAVEQPAGSALTDGATAPLDFGIVAAGTHASRTFHIRNLSGSDLTGLAVTKAANGNPGDFAITAPEAAALGPDAMTTFAVTFSPTAPGVRTTALLIASDGGDETPFAINLAGNQVTQGEAWRQTHFGSTSNTGAGADLNDPDGDGLVNLVEFATRTDPLVWTAPPGTLVKNGSTLELTYTRSKAALTELTIRFEWTESLSGPWSSVGGTNVTVLSDDGVTQVVKSTLPAGPAGKRFLRLRVTRPPG